MCQLPLPLTQCGIYPFTCPTTIRSLQRLNPVPPNSGHGWLASVDHIDELALVHLAFKNLFLFLSLFLSLHAAGEAQLPPTCSVSNPDFSHHVQPLVTCPTMHQPEAELVDAASVPRARHATILSDAIVRKC